MNNTGSDSIENITYISPNKLIALNFFWGGFIVYSVSYVLSGHINEKVCQLAQLAAIAVIFSTFIFLIQFKITNSYLKLIFAVYFLWLVTVIARGIHFDFKSIMYMLLNPDYGVLLYFVPLVILFPPNLNYYKKLFDFIIILGIFFFICDVLYIRSLLDRSSDTKDIIELLARNLALPSGFILLTYKYHSNSRKVFALGVMMVAFLFSIYKARRGLSLTLGFVLFFSFFSYLFSTRQKILTIYLSGLFTCIALLYANSIYNIDNNKLLNLIAERGEEDTRTGVEIFFYNDMQTKDWVIGRGMNGEYYCPGIDDDTDFRTVIETGYLQIILKGGLVRLFLFLLITVPAIFLGLFSSKNLLSKAAAAWIVIALISLYPATVESFSIQYVIVWISVGICYSKKVRNYSDDFIRNFLNNNLRLSN